MSLASLSITGPRTKCGQCLSQSNPVVVAIIRGDTGLAQSRDRPDLLSSSSNQFVIMRQKSQLGKNCSQSDLETKVPEVMKKV